MRQHTKKRRAQQQVWLTNTIFLTASRFGLEGLIEDRLAQRLKGKTDSLYGRLDNIKRRSNSTAD